MNSEMTEILINKYLDSEITPAEQQMLDAELEQNPQSRLLLAELTQLHQQAREVLTVELLEKGESVEVIFQRAQHLVQAKTRTSRRRNWTKIIFHMAAGFVLALGIMSAHDYSRRPAVNSVPMAAETNQNEQPVTAAIEPAPASRSLANSNLARPSFNVDNQNRRPNRQVNWYSYTEPDGTRWMIENYREKPVSTAAYHGDL